MRYTVIALHEPWASDEILNTSVISDADDPIDAVRKRTALGGVNTQPSEPCRFVVVGPSGPSYGGAIPTATLVNYEPPPTAQPRITYGSLD